MPESDYYREPNPDPFEIPPWVRRLGDLLSVGVRGGVAVALAAGTIGIGSMLRLPGTTEVPLAGSPRPPASRSVLTGATGAGLDERVVTPPVATFHAALAASAPLVTRQQSALAPSSTRSSTPSSTPTRSPDPTDPTDPAGPADPPPADPALPVPTVAVPLPPLPV